MTKNPLCCAVSTSEITDHKLGPLCWQRTDYYLNFLDWIWSQNTAPSPQGTEELWSSFVLSPHPLYIRKAAQPSSLTQTLFPLLPATHLSRSLYLPPFTPGWFQNGQQGCGLASIRGRADVVKLRGPTVVLSSLPEPFPFSADAMPIQPSARSHSEDLLIKSLIQNSNPYH